MSSTSNGRRRRRFTEEFKAAAVAMVREAGATSLVARELNIYDSTLGNWVRKANEEALNPRH